MSRLFISVDYTSDEVVGMWQT